MRLRQSLIVRLRRESGGRQTPKSLSDSSRFSRSQGCGRRTLRDHAAPRTHKEAHLPDSILLSVFGVLSVIGLAFGGMSLYFAVKNAKKPDGEIKMALWSFGALAGLVFAGMCWAYFLVPIIINHLFKS